MTDIEMLPLTDKDFLEIQCDCGDLHIVELLDDENVQSYARAVAEHNVKALREEVGRWRTEATEVANGAAITAAEAEARADQAERQRDLAHKGWQLAESAEAEAHARAERLAEALREIHQRAHGGCSPMDCARVAYEALRDHDQEGSDG